MISHPVLPGIDLGNVRAHPAYERYLRDWREHAISNADAGIVSASVVHQAALIDLAIDGRLLHDWISVMDDLLTDEQGRPLAYSTRFGERLYKFEGQFHQSTIHAIYTRWWMENLVDQRKLEHGRFADLIYAKKGVDSLILDIDVSPTILRHRMKAEVSMSAAMGIEILSRAGRLTRELRLELATSLCDPTKVPQLGYMTSEQFRLAALRLLGHEEQFPVGIGDCITACEAGLERGWGDFSIASKVDAYMGTAKRTSRDKPIHSPLVACHVAILSSKVDATQFPSIIERLVTYSKSLAEDPLDIPAFQMRDVPIPFGADLTPIEAVCASFLISNPKAGVGW